MHVCHDLPHLVGLILYEAGVTSIFRASPCDQICCCNNIKGFNTTCRHLRASGLREKISYDFAEQQRFIEAAQLASQDSCSRTLAIPKVTA